MSTRIVAVAAALCFAATVDIESARACGGFFTRAVDPRDKPSLANEQVLLVYDSEEHKQHFIRRVAFRRSDERFGFVVPTPALPEVAKVAENPFPALRGAFPFEGPPPTPPPTSGRLRPGAAGGGVATGGIRVIEQKRIGSFMATVLAATDAKALSKWLADNGLVSSAENDEWLSHYVALEFFFVAMRYDPVPSAEQSDDDSPNSAETMRISFMTPRPYYPYLEPRAPKRLPTDDRVLELWTVAREAWVPVALREGRRYTRPLRPGMAYDYEPKESRVKRAGTHVPYGLEVALRGLVPVGSDLKIQTFQDQKFSRAGFGDIVFAPASRPPKVEGPFAAVAARVLAGDAVDSQIHASAMTLLAGTSGARELPLADVDPGRTFRPSLAKDIASMASRGSPLTVAVGASAVSGAVDQASAARAVASMRVALRRCYRSGANTRVNQSFDFSLTVSGDDAIDARSTPLATTPGFDKCALEAARGRNFPQQTPPALYTVRTPITFKWANPTPPPATEQ